MGEMHILHTTSLGAQYKMTKFFSKGTPRLQVAVSLKYGHTTQPLTTMSIS